MKETSPAVTGENRRGGRFKPGQSGNPAGKPKGARNKLGEDFLEVLHADFREHGPAAIARVREQKPEVYFKVVASLLPKEISLQPSVQDLTDEQLIQRIRILVAELAPHLLGSAEDDELDDLEIVTAH